MPIHQGQDKNGQFYQWGKTGKKYYFRPEDKQSKQRALNKAKKQQTAIYSNGWKGDSFMKLIKVKKKVDNEDSVLKQLSSDFAEQEIGVLHTFKRDLARYAKILQSVRYSDTPQFLEAKKIKEEIEEQCNKTISKLMEYRRKFAK